MLLLGADVVLSESALLGLCLEKVDKNTSLVH